MLYSLRFNAVTYKYDINSVKFGATFLVESNVCQHLESFETKITTSLNKIMQL